MARSLEAGPIRWLQTKFRGIKPSPNENRTLPVTVLSSEIGEDAISEWCEKLRITANQLVLLYGQSANGLYRFVTPPPGWGFIAPPSERICVITHGDPTEAKQTEIFPIEKEMSPLSRALTLIKNGDGQTEGITKRLKDFRDENASTQPVTPSDISEWWRKINSTRAYTESLRNGSY